MKRNILIVMTSLYNGGAERSLINLLNEIDKEKYNIDLLLFKEKGIFIEELPKNINLLKTPEEIKALYGMNSKINIAYARNSLIRIFGTFYSKLLSNNYDKSRQIRWKKFYTKNIRKLEKSYDIAIAYVNFEPLYFVVDKVKATKKIVWVHGDYNSYDLDNIAKSFNYKYFEKCNKVITISHICESVLKQNFPQLKNKIIMLPNINSKSAIEHKSLEYVPNELKSDNFNILSIGRLDYIKGFDMAINAAKYLKKDGIEFKWFILGDGKERKNLKGLIKKLNLEENVFLLGTKSNPYPYIKKCDLFVQSSRYEGKSMVLDEAKILKKIILVTNYQSAKDQIVNGKNGVIVEITPEDIYRGIKSIIINNEMRNKMQQFILKNENLEGDNIIEKYYKLFDE